jgi:hypothetical protein
MVALCYYFFVADPLYPPDRVRELAANEATRAITFSAEQGCYSLGLIAEDVWEVLAELDQVRSTFYKSMESDKVPGTWFDVYHILIGLKIIYLKFRIAELRSGQQIIVVSFKER